MLNIDLIERILTLIEIRIQNKCLRAAVTV